MFYSWSLGDRRPCPCRAL